MLTEQTSEPGKIAAKKLYAAILAATHRLVELRGVFTVDWNQAAPDGSGKPLIPDEVVHALVQHYDQHDLSNKSVPPDVLGRAYEYLIKQFADDAGAKGWRVLHPTRSCRHSGFEKEKPRYSRHAGLSLDSHETFQDFP
jgi:hypothetical protein